ncbi:MAG: 30S ribosomal protein S6, partial [Bacteroidetes bacterium]|nr:30S ribosomal protein S6 [Bacteroidota bacterium]
MQTHLKEWEQKSKKQRMRPYETVLIITPVLSEGELKKTISKYGDMLKKAGAEMTHEEHWGLKQLAYEIKNKSTGYYHIYEY